MGVGFYPPFGPLIPLISFHSILFQTIPLFKFYKPFHSIPFFFNLFFQLSKSLYNIFKSQPFIPPRNSQSQTIQHIFFSNHSKPFSNHFSHPKEWNGMGKMVCPNTWETFLGCLTRGQESDIYFMVNF